MAITKITSSVVANNAIIAAGVAENAITSSEIASNAVGTAQIASGSITTAMLDTNIDIAGTLDVTGVLTADSNVVIAGNLTVNGTTVTNSATNTTIEDALIELGTGTTGTPANDAGIVIERGDSDNAFIGWDESADTFILGTGSFTGASTGDLTISTAPLTTGALTASGLSYPTSDGTANQVITTDGSGNLSFSTVSVQGAVVNNYTATGDGSTTDFDTGINPQNEVNTWVFVGGVYQPKDTYSYSGTTITFSEAPANGEDIDITTGTVAGFDSAETVLGIYTTTTTATDTYDTGLSAANENNTFVFIEGVYQPKSTYTWSGSTITFDANTPADLALEVMATKTLSASAVTTNTIAANAVTSAKIASNAILARHIAANAIGASEIASNAQIVASTFTGALTGNVTGNVTGNLTGTVQTAAQTNITSVGTLSALTVSGDLTVDTSTLVVDSTNNRVGIGTNSPGVSLQVHDSLGTTLDDGVLRLIDDTSYAQNVGAAIALGFKYNSSGNILQRGGVIKAIKENATDGNYASALLFGTTANGASTTERMRIDSSGNVGIGGFAASDGNLQVRKTGINTGITNVLINANFADGSNSSGLLIGYRTDETTAVLAPRTATGNLAIYNYNGAWSESMRIDSSGNLLHGCTGTSGSAISDGGILLRSDSTNFMQISSGSTGDTDLIIFYKKSGTGIAGVGSIGSEGSELTLGQTTAGLQFLGSEARIRPFNMSTNSPSNGVVDLGRSNAKFKDLYLSGAIKMASDLDAYEEGTWTPAPRPLSGSLSGTIVTEGHYVKIGQLVFLHFYVDIQSISSQTAANDYPVLAGIPFTGSASNSYLDCGVISRNTAFYGSPTATKCFMGGSTIFFGLSQAGTSFPPFAANPPYTTGILSGSLVYWTTS